MKDILKKYLEEQAKNDNAIKKALENATDKTFTDLEKYIKDQARKQAKDGYCYIADEVVYKWARDFILGDIITESTEPAESEPVEEIKTQKAEKIDNEEGWNYLFDMDEMERVNA